ncbi:MAG: beta-galactosidase [Spirochaetia bacterium]|nr:beta-galactosidase [Spirochaetia bacterium]
MRIERLKGFAYGGDYNPEQWGPEYWVEDMKLMKKAGVNLISLGIFSWAKLQKDEQTFDFSWLDTVMDLLAEYGIAADLATATAAVPAWAYGRYPDLFPVDKQGNRLWYGSRQTYCPNSPSYHRLTAALVRMIGERYKDHPALAMWHVNNEYSCHVSVCYCDTCAAEFRTWLKQRYGTIDGVNASWGTSFWSQWYYSWEEVMPPRQTTTQHNPGQVLDYQRFMSDSLLNCYLIEKHILREITPDVPITTNFMLEWKPLDYVKWAKEIDVITWDSYPNPAVGVHPARNALDHDLMRGLAGDKPFMLLEQSPSQVNWRKVNTVKYPGLNRLYSMQTIARGGEGVMYFQWRQSRRGAEKFHAACITHTGDEHSRVFKEVVSIGKELKELAELSTSKIEARVGIIYDYENWWAVEYAPGPSGEVSYRAIVLDYYTACYDAHIPVDIIFQESDLSAYDVVIAPLCYMVRPSLAQQVERYVSNGGTFVTSFFSGIADEEDAVFENGYPGPLRTVLGIQVEEFNPLEDHMYNVIANREQAGESTVSLWTEYVRLEGAQAYAEYTQDYLAGEPAVTRNTFGEGAAWYVSARPEAGYMRELLLHICTEAKVKPLITAPLGVEVTIRTGSAASWMFILNFTREPVTVDLGEYSGTDLRDRRTVRGKLEVAGTDLRIIKLD